MHFQMGIIEFEGEGGITEGDCSLLASPFWNHAEVLAEILTKSHLYCFKPIF